MFCLCLFGKGTKISKYLIEHDKVYKAVIALGIKTDTGDITGNVVQKKAVSQMPKKEDIMRVLKSFIGTQMQVPPMYSAIKVKRTEALRICEKWGEG